MSKLKVLAIALFAGLSIVPGAVAGPSITWAVVSGTPGDNGWYLSNVTIQISVTGAGGNTSNPCPATWTFQSSTDVLDCSATDGVGGTAGLRRQFNIDKDKPAVTGASPDRQANASGWYNAPVTVALAGSDATSGIASCQQLSYNGGDSATASVAGTCRDVAGNVSAPFSFALKYDATPPSVSASPGRDADAGGWYNHPVSVSFGGSDATSGIDACTSASYGGPDTSGTTISGSCNDKAGNTSSASVTLQYDSTPPTVKVALGRGPDANGWYNRPVAATATGSDSGSGLDGCSAGSYDGPVSDSASLTGTCKDRAGNSASDSVSLKYDATPPSVSQVTAAPGNGRVTLHWTISPDSSVTVTRSAAKKGSADTTVYHGTGETFTDTKLTNGLRYRYSISVVDQAGNKAEAGATATPLALSVPPQGTRLTRPPNLTWSKVVGASYYNVQLFQGGKKILSVWPLKTSFRLPRSWTFAGKKHTLAEGSYRWYVWPGYGPRKASKYGKLLGGSVFVMRG